MRVPAQLRDKYGEWAPSLRIALDCLSDDLDDAVLERGLPEDLMVRRLQIILEAHGAPGGLHVSVTPVRRHERDYDWVLELRS